MTLFCADIYVKLFIVISLTALLVQLSLSKVAGAMLVTATNGGKVKGIIKLLAPSYIVLATTMSDFPHWLAFTDCYEEMFKSSK